LFAGFFKVFGGPCFISCVTDGLYAEGGECEAVENSEEEETNRGANGRGGRTYECERLKYYARYKKKKVYLGIQDENQSMSMPTTVWKGIISITGRVTVVPEDLRYNFELRVIKHTV
jgi:hypothetical protein